MRTTHRVRILYDTCTRLFNGTAAQLCRRWRRDDNIRNKSDRECRMQSNFVGLDRCWGLMQITIFLFLRNPELPMDLSTSNAVMVNRSSATYPCRPNAGITLPHKSWRWRRCSRPQGREDLGATTPAPHNNTSTYLHMYGDHNVLRNPWSSRNCGSRRHWTESGNSAARRCATVVWSLTYAALREAAQERERERGGGGRRPRGWAAHQGGGRRARGFRCVLCWAPPLGVPLYSGEGVHLTPHPRLPRAAAKGEARVAAARARAGRPPKP
jgi:hypothetical protein